jgi:hypothetical protein
MELRKFFGQSSIVYFVTYSPETYWKAFIETPEGYVKTEAKAAARDCGAQANADPEKDSTHTLWSQLWK